MRIATFNVENLFQRARIMNLPKWSDGRAVLNDYKKLTDLIEKESYSAADKSKLLEIMSKYKGLISQSESKYILLRQNRGKLVAKRSGEYTIVAEGRGDWIGWFELTVEPVDATAIDNTARVIREVNADVLGVVEAENRVGLLNFNEIVLKQAGVEPYSHVMLIDGNDDRGIDVGLMSKAVHPINPMQSHVDDFDSKGNRIFSRDCAEFSVPLGNGKTLLVMMNHLKSQGYGSKAANDARRKAQAQRVREIYDERRAQGVAHIAILGDFNDTPDGDPLAPLLANGSELKDVFEHPMFDDQGRPGTFGNCSKSEKFDYILLSPALWQKVAAGGVERRGSWGGTNGTLWPHFTEVKGSKDAASDHVAVWVDLDL